MKVLLNRHKKKRLVQCKKCKSIMRVALSECEKKEFMLDDGYWTCECPLCKSRIIVKRFD